MRLTASKRLVRALRFYQSAIYLGPAIATLAGREMLGYLSPFDTALGHFEPWRYTEPDARAGLGDLGVSRSIATVAGVAAALAIALILCLAPYRRAMDRAGIVAQPTM